MDEIDIRTIKDDIEYLASERNNRMILNILVGNHPADIADIIQSLSEEHSSYVFGLLDADTASDVLVEIDEVTKDKLVAELQHERLSEIVDEMDSDDAADIVAELPEEVAEKVLEAIDAEDSEEVKELLQHEEDTAGGIMALEFICVSEQVTVDEAIREIRSKAEEVGEVYNVYVIDGEGTLVGYLPLKKMILAKSKQKIRDLMVKEVISVPTDTDQEEVANIFRRYNLVSLPVVDEQKHLVGRITVDDIVDVMEEEASEDIQKMAGISDEEEIRETSVYKISFGRLPWLLVGLVGQLVSALVMKQFQASLEQIFIVAFFIPLMMAMGGNAGIQAATIIVRGIALGEWSPGDMLKRFSSEIRVSLLNGTICGIIIFMIVAIIDRPAFGFVLSLSLLAVILNASFIGASIPLLMRKIGVDPAIATGPLITTFNDIIGIFIYLGLVTLSMQYLQ
jgi:magnesium transporter